MKRVYGNHIGLVISNGDSEFRGRVKVWIPHISATIYDNWNREKKDKKFRFLGENLDSPIDSQLLEELKTVLPWAEYCAPVQGATGSGVYNSQQDKGYVSDSNVTTNKDPIPETSVVFKKYRQNLDNVGEKSGKIFETKAGQVNDAFNDTANNVSKINTHSYNYIPSTYSNSAKGSFSIPNVGSHVWVFFREGNPMHPVYFGVAFGQDDFVSIFNPSQNTADDYPQGYENNSSGSDIYRNKYVFAQKGGTFEIINTDKRESIKISHYSGSFKEYNNQTGIELIATDNQKLVIGDQFTTIKGYYGLFTGSDYEHVSHGNYLKKIGNLNVDLINQWISTYQDIATSKALFEIRRAPYVSARYSSSSQARSGSFGNCPTCGGSGTIDGDTCGTCGGSGLSPSSQNGSWTTESQKANLINLLQSKAILLAEIERKMGRGGNEISNITKHKMESIGLVLNKFNAIRVDPIGILDLYAVTIATTGIYPQQKAFPLIEKVHVDDLPGGTFTHFIGNKYEGIVGAGGYKLKTYGNLEMGGAICTFIGDQIIIGSTNEVIIDGGSRLNLIGDSIRFKSRLGKQIVADGNFGVTKNVVIGGGMHVEGELNIQHITAPLEFQITEPTHIKANCIVRNLTTQDIQQIGDSGGQNQNITAGELYGELEILVDHTHYFRNLPLTLVDGSNAVRNDSKGPDNTDSSSPRGFAPRSDGRKASFQGTNEGPNNGPPPNS
jgi:hypothetical protein